MNGLNPATEIHETDLLLNSELLGNRKADLYIRSVLRNTWFLQEFFLNIKSHANSLVTNASIHKGDI